MQQAQTQKPQKFLDLHGGRNVDFFRLLRYALEVERNSRNLKKSRPSSLEAPMIKDLLKDAESRMKGAIEALENDLTGIRTGRANPALVEKLPVEYYGMETPLFQLASISVPEARVLMIKPFDPSTLKAIEKAVLTSELNLTPNNDGKVIRLNLPPLTEERRRELVKMVNSRLEESRIAIRNIRRDANDAAKKDETLSEDNEKDCLDRIQKQTDEYIKKVESIANAKDAEVLKV